MFMQKISKPISILEVQMFLLIWKFRKKLIYFLICLRASFRSASSLKATITHFFAFVFVSSQVTFSLVGATFDLSAAISYLLT